MPTIFHTLFSPRGRGKASLQKPVSGFWILTALCAMIPDADVLGLAFGINSTVCSASRFYAFDCVRAAFGASSRFSPTGFCKPNFAAQTFRIFFACHFSHPLLDMLTNGVRASPCSRLSVMRDFLPCDRSSFADCIGFFSDRG